MPELAEVEVGRRLAERVAVGKTIKKAICAEDPIVLDGLSAGLVQDALTGAKVLHAYRHGKHLWFDLDRKPCPLFHFGMTGAFRSPDEVPVALKSGIRDGPSWPPRFTKIRMVFDGGAELVMTNARRLGRIRLRDNPRSEPPLSELGFDPYLELPPLGEFQRRIGRRSLPLKGLLLDQGFAAGIGNWLADEILFQARLDPRRPVSELDGEAVKRLRRSMQKVVRTAVDAEADASRYPPGWLFHHRWGKKAGARVRGGHPVEHLTVAGRTTAWVPAVQSDRAGR